MGGRDQQLSARPCFDNVARLHDCDTTGHLAYHCKIVLDEEHCQTVLPLEAPQ